MDAEDRVCLKETQSSQALNIQLLISKPERSESFLPFSEKRQQAKNPLKWKLQIIKTLRENTVAYGASKFIYRRDQ